MPFFLWAKLTFVEDREQFIHNTEFNAEKGEDTSA
jgi:hypothetical protein